MTALHSGSGVGNDRHPIAIFKKGVRLTAVWESDDCYRGWPSSREALRRGPVGLCSAVAHALGGGTEPSHLLQNKFYQ
jgi:hypothetical protein